jgi:hypothetical protein
MDQRRSSLRSGMAVVCQCDRLRQVDGYYGVLSSIYDCSPMELLDFWVATARTHEEERDQNGPGKANNRGYRINMPAKVGSARLLRYEYMSADLLWYDIESCSSLGRSHLVDTVNWPV